MTTSKNETWVCPRCGLEGDRLKSPDPKRCLRCCRIDAADDLYAALVKADENLDAALHGRRPVHNDLALAKTIRAALRRARGEK